MASSNGPKNPARKPRHVNESSERQASHRNIFFATRRAIVRGFQSQRWRGKRRYAFSATTVMDRTNNILGSRPDPAEERLYAEDRERPSFNQGRNDPEGTAPSIMLIYPGKQREDAQDGGVAISLSRSSAFVPSHSLRERKGRGSATAEQHKHQKRFRNLHLGMRRKS